MVKPAATRISHYIQKYSPAITKTRFTDLEVAAKANFATKTNDLVAMEEAVLTVLNTEDTPPPDRPKHYNFAREIWRTIDRGVADPALSSFANDVAYPKWLAHGCDGPTLVAIALNVFSIVVTP